MLITNHWSVTPAGTRLGEYHVEFGLKPGTNVAIFNKEVLTGDGGQVTSAVRGAFNIWKNVDLTTPTSYGTWNVNHDPRDQSANVEIASLCMGGEGVSVAGPWGSEPFTFAHFLMHCHLTARVCKLKGLDPLGSFASSEFPDLLQNGPIHTASTHGERAIQTIDNIKTLRPSFGYFAYSGDPDCRWDLAAPDYTMANLLATPQGAYSTCLTTAGQLRSIAAKILTAGITDMWGLDQPAN